jgi:hypothetical protein
MGLAAVVMGLAPGDERCGYYTYWLAFAPTVLIQHVAPAQRGGVVAVSSGDPERRGVCGDLAVRRWLRGRAQGLRQRQPGPSAGQTRPVPDDEEPLSVL